MVLFVGCECVTVPDRDYACDDTADCTGAQVCVARRCVEPEVDGGSDAGVDAGEDDAGLDAGFDAGVDAGDPFADAGICNTWACIETEWPVPQSESALISVAQGLLPPDMDGGTYGWFGGVLVPDGRVLAIAHTASHFLLFDPVSRMSTTFGPDLHAELLPDGVTWRRFYAGGVLHPNGKVYVFPYHAHRILEVDVAAGTMNPVGPHLSLMDGGFPNYVGGVVDRFGYVWTVSEASTESMPPVRFDPQSGAAAQFVAPPGFLHWGGWWGMARLPDDTLLAFPKEFFSASKAPLSPHILTVTAAPDLNSASFDVVKGFDVSDPGTGFPVQGGSLSWHGAVCGTAAASETRFVCVTSNAAGRQATMHPGPSLASAWGFNGTFGDGRVWVTPDADSRMPRMDGNGGFSVIQVTTPGRYAYLGLVATPQGMVLIPGVPGSQFAIVQPGAATVGGVYDQRPMSVLLSPYFNKL